MVPGRSRHTCLSLSPHTVDTVWGRPSDLHMGHSCPRRSWPLLLSTETGNTQHEAAGQRQEWLPPRLKGAQGVTRTNQRPVPACPYVCPPFKIRDSKKARVNFYTSTIIPTNQCLSAPLPALSAWNSSERVLPWKPCLGDRDTCLKRGRPSSGPVGGHQRKPQQNRKHISHREESTPGRGQ